MSPRAATARSREAPSTRDAILDAAERRFAERGFAGVSMREIAAEAGRKNQASLYHHFRHKRALYEAVLSRGIAPIIALVAESGKSGPGGERGRLEPAVVEAVLDRVLDYLEEHPHLPRLIQRAGLDDNRYLRSALARFLGPLYAQGLSVLAGARSSWEAGELPHLGGARRVRPPAREAPRLRARRGERPGLPGDLQVPRGAGRPARREDLLVGPGRDAHPGVRGRGAGGGRVAADQHGRAPPHALPPPGEHGLLAQDDEPPRAPHPRHGKRDHARRRP